MALFKKYPENKPKLDKDDLSGMCLLRFKIGCFKLGRYLARWHCGSTPVYWFDVAGWFHENPTHFIECSKMDEIIKNEE